MLAQKASFSSLSSAIQYVLECDCKCQSTNGFHDLRVLRIKSTDLIYDGGVLLLRVGCNLLNLGKIGRAHV